MTGSRGQWQYSARAFEIPGLPEESLEQMNNRDSELEFQLQHLYGNWNDWTPGITSGFTQGNGTLTGRYRLVGVTFQYRMHLVMGSTSSITTPKLNLPSGMLLNNSLNKPMLGTVIGYDVGSGAFYTGVSIAGDSTEDVITTAIIYNTTAMSATAPFTWANTDQIWFSGTLELANTVLDT